MITRYDKCWVIRLFKWNKLTIELVYAPRNYSIVEHNHPNINIEICPIFGVASFYRGNRTAEIMPWSIGKHFTVAAGVNHYFTTYDCPLIFMNIERWLTEPTSATKDFYVKTK